MAKKRKKNKKKKINFLKKSFSWIFSIVVLLSSLFLGFNIQTISKITEKIANTSVGTTIEENINKGKEVVNSTINNKEIKYKVIKISDGDTVSVKKIENGKVSGELIRVRMFGIDAPESKQDYGYESKKALINFIGNNEITIKSTGKDKYGRIVGIIFVNGKNINEEMVRTGNAWWYSQYDKNNETLKKYEEYARENKIGLFGRKGYIRPSEFRKMQK